MIRLAIRAPAESSERVLASLVDLAPSGFEQVDGEGFVEFAIYGVPGELPTLPLGEAVVGGVRVSVRGEDVPDDWAERWKRFHRPVLVGGRIYVRPPWEEAAIRPGVEEIVIDPGAAFGTGTHPTTRLCLELLLEHADTGAARHGSLADLGCGSGILAIAAARLGYRPVVAVDCDRAAVTATDRNARANAVRLARVERLDLRREAPPRADVLLANLMRPLLLSLAGRMPAGVSAVIASGLLGHEADEVAAAFAPLVELRRLTLGGWSALLLTSG